MKSLAILAIGGNSLIKDKDHVALSSQYEAIQETSKYIAELIAEGLRLVITHGNGPQVGFIYRRGELACHELPLIPLDICGADTQGAIGYMIQKALFNEFHKRGIAKKVVTVVTQAIVDRDDPSFKAPSKPIGSFMSQDEAAKRRDGEGWNVVEDAGRGWRRIVASPIPQQIVERDAIKALIDAGFIVVAVGGGGIPVVKDENGDLVGVSAVIDKDFASGLMANAVNADLFLISTAGEKVALNYGKPNQVWLDRMTLAEAKDYLAQGHFAKGSMGPKIQAIIWYLERGGKEALVTNPESIARALRGESGTWVVA